jgi:hypothetical protein
VELLVSELWEESFIDMTEGELGGSHVYKYWIRFYHQVPIIIKDLEMGWRLPEIMKSAWGFLAGLTVNSLIFQGSTNLMHYTVFF